MTLQSPTIVNRQKILIVDRHQGQISILLKTYLKKFDNNIYISPHIPTSLSLFDYCFIIGEDGFLKKMRQYEGWKKIIIIIPHEQKKATQAARTIKDRKIAGVKVIASPDEEVINSDQIEEMVWFGIARSSEVFLTLLGPSAKKKLPQAPKILPRTPLYFKLYLFFEKFASKKRITLLAILLVLIYHFMFVVPLLYGGLFIYRATSSMQKGDIPSAVHFMDDSVIPIKTSRSLYLFARPTFLLFSLAQFPDDIFAVHEKAMQIVHTAQQFQLDMKKAFSLVLKKDKTPSELKETARLIQSTKDTLSELEINLVYINQKIPALSWTQKYKDKLNTGLNMIIKAKKIAPFITDLFAQNGEKKYLLLFANNMELRPGGGFIGSYGILTMNNLTLTDLQVYDVYDADGQLTAHVTPPDPIRDYLNQPHWFLRDSAFSPDFYDNYFQAKFFLDKEKQLTDFSGGILITTTAIKNILQAYGNIFLPDFNEKVNADNFYLKTELYAEKGFFPGSTQKKSFLSALTRQIFINLETISPQELINQIFNSLEEKQLVLYIEKPALQEIIDSYYWAGRIIEPHCPPDITNCYTDFLFPYDANLGVNKANFYVNRTMGVKINIDTDGIIHSQLTIKFKNESLQDIFPGGVYRNYFQVLLPRDSIVKKVMLGDAYIQDYHQDVGQFKKVGFFFDTPIQSTQVVTIEYQSLKGFQQGKSIYQLLFQKQIGSINNDLSVDITLPANMFLVNQNFSPLVKNNQILYNTELSADKIFFVELLKE